MNRRQFIRIGSATAAVSAVPWAACGGTALVEPVALARGVHVLGPTPASASERLVKSLSDDVFTRVTAVFRQTWPRRTLRVVAAGRAGDAYGEGTLSGQWNTSYVLPTSFTNDAPPYLPIDHFRWATDRWIGGSVMCPARPVWGPWAPARGRSDGVVNANEMFADLRVIGMPFLPDGVIWRAHYIDEDTGIVMRALGALDFMSDEFLCRWDVIGG